MGADEQQLIRRERFRADYGTDFAAGAPTAAPITGIRDVILCGSEHGGSEIDDGDWRAHLPVGMDNRFGRYPDAVEQVAIGRDAVLTRLEEAEAAMVMNACDPRGHHVTPIRPHGQRYTFVCERPLEDLEHRQFAFDPDGVLGDTLQLSRLVRDHGFSLQYAARILDYEDGESCVVPMPGTEGKAAYRLRRDREWLDAPEARELADLAATYWALEGLPDRVGRAMFRHEYASWQRYGDVILTMLAGGFEALLKVERGHATRQFVRRTAALAEELEVEGLDRGCCGRLYEARSAWAHGAHVALFDRTTAGSPNPDPAQHPALGEIALLQDALRRAVRKALEDADFRAIFESDEAIADRWPA